MTARIISGETVVRSAVLAVFASVGLLLSYPGLLGAQPMGPDEKKGRVSGTGELQNNPKKEEVMDPDRPAPPVSIKGEILDMEKLLGRPLEAPAGADHQPSLDLVQASSPQQGKGEQVRSTPAATTAHLNLILRITESGEAEVLNATEVAGEAVVSDLVTGDFVYEVSGSGGVLAVETLQDPFELRSFSGPPGSPTQGHHISRAKTATITLKVPATNLSSAGLDKLQLRLYSIKPGAPLAQVNTEVLQKLKLEGRLDRRVEFSGSDLARQILQKGRPLRTPQ